MMVEPQMVETMVYTLGGAGVALGAWWLGLRTLDARDARRRMEVIPRPEEVLVSLASHYAQSPRDGEQQLMEIAKRNWEVEFATKNGQPGGASARELNQQVHVLMLRVVPDYAETRQHGQHGRQGVSV